MTQCILEETKVTDISLKPRLVFDCLDSVMRNAFTKVDDRIAMHPAYLPSRQTLVSWVDRLKAGNSQLKTFKLVIEFNTFDTDLNDLPEHNKLLDFEYRENAEHRRPIIQENMDLRHQQLEANARQFTYQDSQSAVAACYDQLIRDAEASRQGEALAGVNAQAGLPPGDGAVVIQVDAD
jgi:hypothetical protein